MKKKRILGINGSPKREEFSSSHFLLQKALEGAEAEGAETELINLADFTIKECKGCAACLDNRPCPLHDDPDDQHEALYRKCLEADAFIFSSPVYALSLPSLWKKWIDRCDKNTKDDLQYEIYNYDTVEFVKGKAFRGKVAGQIAVAAGLGHEMALASLMPAFTAVKLTIVANIGISLIEYDAEPGIRNEEWSKNISEAEFAIQMAQALGKRVYETIGYSAFDRTPQRIKNLYQSIDEIKQVCIEDINGKTTNLGEIGGLFIGIIANQSNAVNAARWYLELTKLDLPASIKIKSIASIGTVPHFITHEFIKNNIQQQPSGSQVSYDWDGNLKQFFDVEGENPCILIMDMEKSIILFADSLELDEIGFKKIQLQVFNWMNV